MIAWLAVMVGVATAAEDRRAAEEFFEAKVRPILVEKCQSCHGEKKQSGGLRLDSRAGVIAGGDRGPVVGRIVEAVRRTGELKMPPKEPLAEPEVAAIAEWVRLGLPWAADEKGNRPRNRRTGRFSPLRHGPFRQTTIRSMRSYRRSSKRPG